MANVLLVNIDIDMTYLKTLREKLKGHHVDVINLEKEQVRACIQCGKCIKKNFCVQDGHIKDISDLAGTYDVFIFGTEILYGEISEKCEHVMTKLMHSSSNMFSHKILLPLFSSRSMQFDEAGVEMSSYIAEAGGILLTSWLKAEIHHEEDMEYALNDLLWVLDGLDFDKKPRELYQRNLQFTR